MLLAAGRASGLPMYYLTDLGDLPGDGDYSLGHGINQVGNVVGESNSAAPMQRGFLWTPLGGLQNLGMLPGDVRSVAAAINNLNQIAGTSFAAGGASEDHAFVWSPGSGFVSLGLLPGATFGDSLAWGINNLGQVVGTSGLGAVPGSHAFLWSPSTGMMDLGAPQDPFNVNFSLARDINDAGQVVGLGFTDNPQYSALLWTAPGRFINLGVLPGFTTASDALAINQLGHVVGMSGTGITPTDITRAFIWTPNTGMINLGTLPNGSLRSVAYDINDFDVVVGDSTSVAFAWTKQEGMVDLNTRIVGNSGLRLKLTSATAINDFGQIAGTGVTAAGNPHAFLLTPVPEPSPVVLATTGLMVFARTVCRRRAITAG